MIPLMYRAGPSVFCASLAPLSHILPRFISRVFLFVFHAPLPPPAAHLIHFMYSWQADLLVPLRWVYRPSGGRDPDLFLLRGRASLAQPPILWITPTQQSCRGGKSVRLTSPAAVNMPNRCRRVKRTAIFPNWLCGLGAARGISENGFMR